MNQLVPAHSQVMSSSIQFQVNVLQHKQKNGWIYIIWSSDSSFQKGIYGCSQPNVMSIYFIQPLVPFRKVTALKIQTTWHFPLGRHCVSRPCFERPHIHSKAPSQEMSQPFFSPESWQVKKWARNRKQVQRRERFMLCWEEVIFWRPADWSGKVFITRSFLDHDNNFNHRNLSSTSLNRKKILKSRWNCISRVSGLSIMTSLGL